MSERFFSGWMNWIAGNRLISVLLVLVVTGIAIWGQVRHPLMMDNSPEAFVGKDTDVRRALELFREEFGHDSLFMILVEGEVFTTEFLTHLKKLHQELASIDVILSDPLERAQRNEDLTGFTDFDDADAGAAWGDEKGGSIFTEVTSLINVRDTTYEADGLRVGGLLERWPLEDELPGLKKKVLGERSYVGRVVGKAGRHAMVLIRTVEISRRDTTKVYLAVDEVVRRLSQEGFAIHTAGNPALVARSEELSLRDMKQIFILSCLLMVVALGWVFRHPVGIIVPGCVIVLSNIWTFGLMAWMDKPSTFLTSILPVFLVAVGVADSIHFQSVYRELKAGGMESAKALAKTGSLTGLPMLFTTLTTMTGLFSFMFAELPAIQELGIFGGMGVGIAFILTLVLMPICLSLFPESLDIANAGNDSMLKRWVDRANLLSGRRGGDSIREDPVKRNRVLALGILVLVLAAMMWPRIRVWHEPIEWYPEDEPIRVAFRQIDQHMGGASQLTLLVEPKGDKGLRNLKLLQGLEKVESEILAYHDAKVDKRLAGNAISILDVVRETRRALYDGREEYYGLPETQAELNDILFVFENASPDRLRRLTTLDLTLSHMTFTVQWLPAGSYGPMTEYIGKSIDKHLASMAQVEPTGIVYMFYLTINQLLADLIRSFASAFIVISFLMIFILGDLKLGLISMVPNLLPIAMLLGFMGAVDIPIDLATVLVASLALGLCVDDTIHFLHHFKVELQRTGDTDRAIDVSLQCSGRAIMITSIVLVATTCLYPTAVLKNMDRFGILVSMTIVFAVFVDLIVGPALLRFLYPPKSSASQSGA
ncbi:MAG: MMPL family transporter [Deltaproteobacteria bacterium]|nr:MMPL family transporter [Deltaproteobacteria bacterium]